jgi:hypothetical protein
MFSPLDAVVVLLLEPGEEDQGGLCILLLNLILDQAGSRSSCCPWSLSTRLARWRADGAGPVRICSFLAFFSRRHSARRVLAVVPLLPALSVPVRATLPAGDRLAQPQGCRAALG